MVREISAFPISHDQLNVAGVSEVRRSISMLPGSPICLNPGAIAADICTHLNPLPIKGVIWLAGLPYIGDVLPIVATPLVLSFIPGITAPESPAHALQSRIEFCKTLVAPERLSSVPFAELSSWVGAASFLLPQQGALALGRKQDPVRLKEEGAKGLPLCIIHGKADLQITGANVVEEMEPHFKDCEVNLLDGIGHSPFWEAPGAVADIILKFVARVNHHEVGKTQVVFLAERTDIGAV